MEYVDLWDFKRFGIKQTIETYLKIARRTDFPLEEISEECLKVIDLWAKT